MGKLLGEDEKWVMSYSCASRSPDLWEPKGRLVVSDKRVRFVPKWWRPDRGQSLAFDQPWGNVEQLAVYGMPRRSYAVILVHLTDRPRRGGSATDPGPNLPYPFWARGTASGFVDLVMTLPKVGLARVSMREDVFRWPN